MADRLGLTGTFSKVMASTRSRRSAHDPGVVLRDLAVAFSDGGDCVSDLDVLAGLLRSGNAGANTVADHSRVRELALEQIPKIEPDRRSLIRCDGGGATHAFTHDLREAKISFSIS